MVEIRFDEATHTYTRDGIVVPSVTQIMKPLSGEAYKMIPQYNLDAAARRGTAVHEACEIFNKYGIAEIDDDLQPYLDAYLEWFKLRDPKPIDSEMVLYNPKFNYAGTCDFLCEIDGEKYLIDFKTTSTVHTDMCGVQLEAYAKALEENDIAVDKKMILHLTNTGKYHEHIFNVNDKTSWRVFLSCLDIMAFLKKGK